MVAHYGPRGALPCKLGHASVAAVLQLLTCDRCAAKDLVWDNSGLFLLLPQHVHEERGSLIPLLSVGECDIKIELRKSV